MAARSSGQQKSREAPEASGKRLGADPLAVRGAWGGPWIRRADVVAVAASGSASALAGGNCRFCPWPYFAPLKTGSTRPFGCEDLSGVGR